jgi:hypothetical protein
MHYEASSVFVEDDKEPDGIMKEGWFAAKSFPTLKSQATTDISAFQMILLASN